MTKAEFVAMLDVLADAWSRRDYRAAIRWFAADVRYADPLRYEFTSRAALLAFYQADGGHPQRTEWHTRLFGEIEQRGMAEYSYEGTHRYHGIVVIRVRGTEVTHWREYQHIDPRSWQDFSESTAGL